MSNLTTRAGKGSPLTNNELDANFTNLNADKVEIGGDLSGTPTAPIVTKVQGQSFSSAAANVGEKLVWNGTAWAPATDPSGEPIGHADKSESSIGFSAGTRTFTISPVSASFVVWCKGVKHTYTSAQTVVIPNTTGLHFIYFNASGVLSTQMTYFTWEEHAPTAYIYWNATTQQAVYFGDERHGITLDWQTHEYLHRTRGAAIANGFGASGYTTTGAGATDADAQIDIGGGTFFDEDMQVDIVSTNTPVAGTWQQDLSGPALIPVLYLSGSSWVLDSPTNFPFKVVSGVPQYNLYSGGTWSTAPVSNNEYFVSWILATNNLTYPVIAIISQAPTNQLSGAEAMTFEGLNLNGFPSVEFRPLYKVIYQYKTGFTNSIKASTISVYDLRSLQSAGVAAALVQDHGNLSGLGDDDHAQYLHVSEVRSPTQAVKNSFLPSQTSNNGKYLTTDGTNPSWGSIPSGSLTFTGDVTGSGTTGSPVALTLANSGVTTGTYSKVTVDAKGRVTSGANIASSDVTTALGFTPENVANKAVANGYASLDSSGKVPSNQLPSYVDDALEYANLAAFPGTGETGKIYVAIDNSKVYRWSGSAYVEISPSPGSTDSVTEGSANLYFTNARARAAVSASGSLSYSTLTGVFSYTQPTNVSTFTNDSGYLTGITGAQVTTALGYTPYNSTNPAGYISGITSGMVTTALGYTPPQPNGTGATGTWNISVGGNAATVTNGLYSSGTNSVSSAITLNTTSDNWMWLYRASSGNEWYSGPTTANFGVGANRYAISSSGASSQSELILERGTTKLLEVLQANLQYKGNVVLHAGNYTSGYFKTINGTSITGTGDITVSGSDATKLPLSGGTVTGVLEVTGGSRIIVQNSVDGGNTRGIFMWNSSDPNWGIYMAQSGSGRSLSGGTAPSGLDGRTSHAIRFRVADSVDQIGFLWENSANTGLMQLVPNTGNLYTRGAFQAGTAFTYDNPGGWNANIVAAGSSHARFRLRATSYAGSGDRETYLWLDNTVNPATGMYSSASTFAFGGSIGTVQVAGNTVLHAGNYTNNVYNIVYGDRYDSSLYDTGAFGRNNLNVDQAFQQRSGFFDTWAVGGTNAVAGYSHNTGFVSMHYWNGSTGYGVQIGGNHENRSTLKFRWRSANGINPWYDLVHSGNVSTYALPIVGGSLSGNLNLASNWLLYDDTNRDVDAEAYYPNSATRAVRFSFANASSTGTGGNFAGVMHFHPWDGTSASTGDASYQLVFGSTAINNSGTPRLRIRNGINSSWNAWYEILTLANYGTYALPLSGGTLTGNISFSNGADRIITLGSSTNWNYSLRSEGDNFRLYDAAGTTFMRAYYNGTEANKYVEILGSNLRVYNNGSIYSSNKHLADSWWHSDRDFPNGTLIQTDINYAVTSGDPFILEIRGNSYGDSVPYDIQYQGYIYYDTIINHGGYSNGTYISGMVAINYLGNLCFWFPRQSYWNGFYARVYVPYATYPRNRVTNITNSVKPTTAKEVNLSANLRQSLHSGNFNSYAPTLTGSGASGTWGINVTGSAASLSGYYRADDWLRTVGDGYQFKIYGNSRSVIFRTDGASNSHGGGGYPYIWYYGSSGDGERRMILNTDGQLWTNYYGWLQDYFLPKSGGTMSGILYSSGIQPVGVGTNSNISSSDNYKWGYQEAGAWTHPYPDLIIGYHTGMKFGANTSYGGMRFFSDHPGLSSTQLFSIGDGDSNVRVYNSLFVTSEIKGYDVYTTGGWFRNHTNNNGIYWSATGWHLYPKDSADFYIRSGNNESSLNFLKSDAGSLGYIHFASDAACGFLTTSRGWRFRVDNSGNARCYNNLYLDQNYGHGIVGVYSSTRYQGVFAMGDSYKLPADGTSAGNLYGMAWSYPSAGGVAGNLDSHGMLVLINGGFGSCMSYSIKASGNVTAYSDERLKTNWRPMPESFVERLAAVKVGIYDRTDGERITQVGVSAQSLQRLLPEAITKAGDEMGTLSVSYGNAAMASAVELAKELVKLKRELAELKSRLH